VAYTSNYLPGALIRRAAGIKLLMHRAALSQRKFMTQG
jgi:hypothetical protein